jgi:hypothetical protein
MNVEPRYVEEGGLNTENNMTTLLIYLLMVRKIFVTSLMTIQLV